MWNCSSTRSLSQEKMEGLNFHIYTPLPFPLKILVVFILSFRYEAEWFPMTCLHIPTKITYPLKESEVQSVYKHRLY